jgi:hypothetical protein
MNPPLAPILCFRSVRLAETGLDHERDLVDTFKTPRARGVFQVLPFRI